MQELICWSTAAAAACMVYALTAPPGFSIPYATVIGLVFGLTLNSLRSALLEELYKVRAVTRGVAFAVLAAAAWLRQLAAAAF